MLNFNFFLLAMSARSPLSDTAQIYCFDAFFLSSFFFAATPKGERHQCGEWAVDVDSQRTT
jgi:hypothetical protein